jgi:hypothetical protein
VKINISDYAIPEDADLDEWEVQAVGRGGSLFVQNVRTGKRRAFMSRGALDKDPRETTEGEAR